MHLRLKPRAGRARARRSIAVEVLALVAYLALALAVFSAVGPFDARHLPDAGVRDPAQMVWFLAYTPWAVLHGHNPYATTVIDYPHGVNLATNTSVPLLGLLGAPVTLLAGPVATFNVLLRLALAGSAASLYLCLRRFSTPAPARFVGGLVYGFGPYLIDQSRGTAHLDLAFGVLVPVLFLLLYDALTSARRPLVTGALLGLCAAAQLAIAPEVLFQFAVLGLCALVVAAACHPHALFAGLRRLALAAAGALPVFALLGGPFLYELFFGSETVSGPTQPVSLLQGLSADLSEAIVPTSRQLLAPRGIVALGHFASRNGAELGGYLSIPLLVLLVVLVVLNWRVSILRWCAGLGLGAFVLSLGGTLTVSGPQGSTPLPERVFAHLRLLDNTVPARFGLEVALFAGAAIAIGLGELSRSARPLALKAGTWALAALSLVAIAPAIPLKEGHLTWPQPLPATLAAALPKGAVVLVYPFPDGPSDEAMVWQAEDRFSFSMLGGYAVVPGPHGSQLYATLLAPKAVQDFVEYASNRAPRYLPFPPAPTRALLCRYLSANHVTDVVHWPGGRLPGVVAAMLRRDLGPPALSAFGMTLYKSSACSTRP